MFQWFEKLINPYESYNEKDDKYYVSKIENYLGEWENWYARAEDMLEDGELDSYTKQESRHGSASSSNTFVV